MRTCVRMIPLSSKRAKLPARDHVAPSVEGEARLPLRLSITGVQKGRRRLGRSFFLWNETCFLRKERPFRGFHMWIFVANSPRGCSSRRECPTSPRSHCGKPTLEPANAPNRKKTPVQPPGTRERSRRGSTPRGTPPRPSPSPGRARRPGGRRLGRSRRARTRPPARARKRHSRRTRRSSN